MHCLNENVNVLWRSRNGNVYVIIRMSFTLQTEVVYAECRKPT